MNKHNYIQYCLNILGFDNIKPQLSIAERCYLHKQWVFALNQKDGAYTYPIAPMPPRISQLGRLIEKANWERPELKYNQDRVLEVLDPTTLLYKTFIPAEFE